MPIFSLSVKEVKHGFGPMIPSTSRFGHFNWINSISSELDVFIGESIPQLIAV